MPLQNFGSQTDLNQNLANTFNYSGDFSQGGWGTFAQTLTPEQQAQAQQMEQTYQSVGGAGTTTANTGGVPRQQDFGTEPDLNQILSRMYNYTGDFSQGGWGDYFNTLSQPKQQQASSFINEYNNPATDWGQDPALNQLLSQEFGYQGDFQYGGWGDFYNQMSPSEQARADEMIAAQRGGDPALMGLPEQSMGAYTDALSWTNKALETTPEQLSNKNLDPYMDPYQRMVIDAQMQEMNRQHEIQGTYRDAQATKAGALGGDRQAVYNSEADRNFAEQQNRWLSQLLSANFGQAQEGAKFDIGGQRQDRVDTYQGAYQLGGLSELGFDMGQKLMQGTEAMGVTQRGIEQSILDGSLEQYLTTMGFPADMARLLSSSLPGASNQTGSDASNDAQLIETMLKTFVELYKSSQTTS